MDARLGLCILQPPLCCYTQASVEVITAVDAANVAAIRVQGQAKADALQRGTLLHRC